MVVGMEALCSAAAEQCDITNALASKVLHSYIKIITDSLAKGDKVQIVGFGSFEVRERSARKGHNPQTGEEIDIPAKNTPCFSAGKNLKDAVN